MSAVEPCEARGVCVASGHLVFCSLADGHVGDHYGIDVATAGSNGYRAEYHQTWAQSRHDSRKSIWRGRP